MDILSVALQVVWGVVWVALVPWLSDTLAPKLHGSLFGYFWLIPGLYVSGLIEFLTANNDVFAPAKWLVFVIMLVLVIRKAPT